MIPLLAWSINLLGIEPLFQIGLYNEFNSLHYSLALMADLDQILLRGGYFHEHETKGNRKYFTIGSALKLNVFQIDFAYLIPANSSVRSPLENTMRFTLVFDIGAIQEDGL